MQNKVLIAMVLFVFAEIVLAFWFLNPFSVKNEEGVTKLSIGYRPTVIVDLAFIQAVDNGVFKKAGFDITLKPYGSADLLFKALELNIIQGSLGVPLESVLGMAAKGYYPYRGYIIWCFDVKNHFDGFVVPSNSPINSLKDLDGKVIGSHPSRQVTYFVSQMLPNATVQQYNPATPLLSVKSGDQAAAYILEPAISMAVVSEEYRLVEQGSISRYVFGSTRVPAAMSLLSNNWIENNPIEASRFVQLAQTIQKKEIAEPDINLHEEILTKPKYGGYSKNVANQVVEPISSLPAELNRDELLKFSQVLRNGNLLEGVIDFDKLFY